MKRFLILFVLLTTVSGFSQTINPLLNSFTESIRKEYKIPALAAAYITTDSIYYGISGTTKINNSQKVTLKSKFHLGSNTKAITSFVAMKLIEENKISLDTKFFDLFQELKSDKNTQYHSITLGDLLSHTARIQPYTSGFEYSKLPELKGDISEKRKAFAEFVLSQAPVTKGTYSNAGYALASLMLEKTSGKSYEDLIKITFSQLELDCFFGFPNRQDINSPWGHWTEADTPIPLGPDHFYKLNPIVAPAGDISMNIVDYSKFVQLHLKGLNKDNYLKSQSYQTLLFGKKDMAYGWGNAKINDLTFGYHDGSAGTFYAHLIISVDMNVAVVILANSADVTSQNGIYRLKEMIIQNYDEF